MIKFEKLSNMDCIFLRGNFDRCIKAAKTIRARQRLLCAAWEIAQEDMRREYKRDHINKYPIGSNANPKQPSFWTKLFGN